MPPFESTPCTRTVPAWIAGARPTSRPHITEPLPAPVDPPTSVDTRTFNHHGLPSSARPRATRSSSEAPAADGDSSNAAARVSVNDHTISHDVAALDATTRTRDASRATRSRSCAPANSSTVCPTSSTGTACNSPACHQARRNSGTS